MADHVCVVTAVNGRHDHLRRQVAHLRALAAPVRHVIVSMADPDIPAVLGPGHPEQVLCVDKSEGRLPLALARNTGVEAALLTDPDVVFLLDVDCLPAPSAVTSYRDAARHLPDALLAGPVTYLGEHIRDPEPEDLDGLRNPHPARPAPGAGELVRHGDHDLFWSLNAAFTPSVWHRIGGFCTAYTGYGAEDTDFGWMARAREVELVWVGGADAYHQHHPVSRPPIEHTADIVRNATIAFRRWNRWPMQGWLDELTALGHIEWRDGLPHVSAG